LHQFYVQKALLRYRFQKSYKIEKIKKTV